MSEPTVKYKKIYAAIIATVLLGGLWFMASGQFFARMKDVTKTDMLMDTSVTVKIFTRDREEGQRLLDEAFEEGRRVEHIMEPLKGDGELQRINARTVGGWVSVSAELARVLSEADRFYRLSEGAFDPTVAPVKWLWDFEQGGHVPSDSDMEEALAKVGMRRIKVSGDSLYLPDTSIKLDLGGIAKGYAVDCMMAYLKERGVTSILINAGGDIALHGKKPGNHDWVIGLRHPRLNRSIVLPENPYPSVATSGDYERYFMFDGERYHHILDPSTGFPARGCTSVTVWTDTAMDADLLATTIFVLGPEKGIAFADSLENVEACVYYERDGRLVQALSSGIDFRIGL